MRTLATVIIALGGSADLLSLFSGVSCSCVSVETKRLMMVTLLEIGAFMQFNKDVLYKYLQLDRERKCKRYLGEKCCLLITVIEIHSSDKKKSESQVHRLIFCAFLIR